MKIYFNKFKFESHLNARFVNEYIFYKRVGFFPFYKWQMRGYCSTVNDCYLIAKTYKIQFEDKFYL